LLTGQFQIAGQQVAGRFLAQANQQDLVAGCGVVIGAGRTGDGFLQGIGLESGQGGLNCRCVRRFGGGDQRHPLGRLDLGPYASRQGQKVGRDPHRVLGKGLVRGGGQDRKGGCGREGGMTFHGIRLAQGRLMANDLPQVCKA